mgnify:CR=1 FL=1
MTTATRMLVNWVREWTKQLPQAGRPHDGQRKSLYANSPQETGW